MPLVDSSYEPGSANSLAAYYQKSQENRNILAAQNRANKLGDLQYGQEVDKENTARALKSYFANKNPNDPDFREGLRMIVGPQGVMDYDTKEAATEKARIEAMKHREDFLDQLKRNISSNPSDENVISWGQDAVIKRLFTKDEAERNTAELLKLPLEERARSLMQSGATAEQRKPTNITIDRGGQHDVFERGAFGGPLTPRGSFADVPKPAAVEAQDLREKLAGRSPPAMPTPAAPVPVVDPNDPTKIILVDRNEAITKRMTPANAQDQGLAPKEILARNARYPAQTQAIKAFEAQSDSFLGDLKKLAEHPGLSSITGLIAGRTPNLTGDARAAQALYKKIVSKGGFSVLQAIREASKTGGALGNLSNQEGAQLKEAFAAIEQTQNTEDVQNALQQAISELEASKVRMREAYDSTYEYKNTERGGRGGGAGVDSSNPLLK
jgi:hypothetical protein